ncbi:RHS repeat-associated core domain-containing protein, partial [Methylicorpusculum sp.]|uniref:RHS repeat-associated core and ParB domain-containing protein n=1 Tax=Methylicorpusculum sp. TaxID=2713644 RepID=UPI002AB84209
SYGPYGEPNATTGVRFRYTGQQLLGPLNLYYYKARMYSPAIGRFLQTDPIGYQDGLNLYAYVGNNPFNRNDPSGLIAAEAIMLAGNYMTDRFGDPKTWAGQGAAYGGVSGAIVGGLSGGAGGGAGGTLALPGVGTISGVYAGATAGAIQGAGLGAAAGGFLGAAAADLYYQAQSNDNSTQIQENPRNLVPTQAKGDVSGSQIQRLSNDMRQNGFDQSKPVDVWRNPDTGRLEIQDGHHRTAAAIKAGLDKIPVQVWE